MNTESNEREPGPAPAPPRRRLPWGRLAAAGAILLVGIAVGVGASRLAMRSGGGASASAVKKLFQCPMHPAITSDHESDCPICGMKLVEVKGAGAEAAAKLYQCPMHPTIQSDHESDCPICGMKLVEVKDAGAGAAAGGDERKILFYRSPMDPSQMSHTPRKDEMGMDYVPVYEGEAGSGAPAVDGLATVTIDPARQQLIGLRTAPVRRGQVSGDWRTVGRVEVDPTRVRRTNVKVQGYVEKLFVDFVGLEVRRGQPLFSLYSPELLAAQNEYVLALKTRDALARSGEPNADGESLVAASRRKLELWDVPADAIERLEKTRIPERTLTFRSPVSGVVTVKNVVQGSTVRAGDTTYEITDLGMVWVMADAYEGDLGHVRLGMPASLTLKTYPGRRFRGDVAFIDPQLDPATRTVKVHMHFPNPAGLLKPEMFGDVVLGGRDRDGLLVPADAVLRSGTRDVVFLALGDGKFAPREVKLGARSGSEVEVLEGLEAGQQVVTRANFLVDSESQLRASLAELTGKRP